MKDVLLVDDDRRILETIGEILERKALSFEAATSVEEALSTLGGETFRVVLTDVKMPGQDGHSLLREIKSLYPDTEVVLLTGFGSVEGAVSALKEGAYDYILKPFEREALEGLVGRALEKSRLVSETRELRKLLSERYRFHNVITRDERLLKALDLLETVSDFNATIMITGETGTGKELIAKSAHFNGNRKNRPFVKVNCSAIPEGLLESELFGHEKGAFTHATARRIGKFEHADGGTIFLDECADIPRAIQVKLLRVLEQKEFERVGSNETVHVDVRVIAATNSDPCLAMAEGRIREDLFHRLNVIPISIPPLRERKCDIPLLVEHFLDKFGGSRQRTLRVSPEAMRTLVEHDWPGNVRELENLIERLSIIVKGPLVRPSDLPEQGRSQKCVSGGSAPGGSRPLRDVEKEHILKTLQQCRGNVAKTARLLGIDRTTLARRLKKYGVGEKSSRKTHPQQFHE
ncbi:MAG: sigma-54 dependent transcriptional regulator [Candidatus Eisenbacteria bacterium]|nr:sigma-54 dependent transcriptional regulator [Candidatus Eisenbacteria bacterium]